MRQPHNLCKFRAEILEHIALEVVLADPLGPPKDLVPLLCTWHNILAFDRCHDLSTRIGHKSIRSTGLALQIKKYCINLQDLHRGDICSSCIHDVLHMAFVMAMEIDG